MDFFVIYLDKTGNTGSTVIQWKEFNIPSITREVHDKFPDADVRCIIPRGTARLVP